MALESSKEKTSSIMKILTSNAYDDNLKLHYIQRFKGNFKPPEGILGNIKLESLLKQGRVSLKSKPMSKDFLINYGINLINYIEEDFALDVEIFLQLEFILSELQEQHEGLPEKLLKKMCQLQNESFLHFDGILKVSKPTFEKLILDLVENSEGSQMEFLTKMSANSPKLFQIVISILHALMVETLGHWRVCEVTESFVSSVFSFCKKNDKDFLALYQHNCRKLVSLLIVSPNLYSDETIKNEILKLLMEMFLADKKMVLILLAHYPYWLCVFRNYLVKKNC